MILLRLLFVSRIISYAAAVGVTLKLVDMEMMLGQESYRRVYEGAECDFNTNFNQTPAHVFIGDFTSIFSTFVEYLSDAEDRIFITSLQQNRKFVEIWNDGSIAWNALLDKYALALSALVSTGSKEYIWVVSNPKRGIKLYQDISVKALLEDSCDIQLIESNNQESVFQEIINQFV